MDPEQPEIVSPGGSGPGSRSGSAPGYKPEEPGRSIGRALLGFKIPWWIAVLAVVIVLFWTLIAGAESRGIADDLRQVSRQAVVDVHFHTPTKVLDQEGVNPIQAQKDLAQMFMKKLGAKKATVEIDQSR